MKIAFCGDSFTAGIGCMNLYTQPYPVLVSKHFNAQMLNFARGGASNYAIHLQAVHAIQIVQPDILIISMTSMDRFDWFAEGYDHTDVITARQINYHEYAPFNYPQPNHDRPLPHPFRNDPEYTPMLLSQNVATIQDALDHPSTAPDSLRKEPKAKLKKILSFYAEILPWHVKMSYDAGVISRAYIMAQKQGIRCIVIGHEREIIESIPERDFIEHNWFAFSEKFPDSIKSNHASEDGHQAFSETLVRKLEQT